MIIDFIPKKIVVGKCQSSENGWVTCRYEDDKWTGESIFSRLTGGFKPHLQLDSTKELKKTISGASLEFDNTPINGFKFVRYGGGYSYKTGNIYGITEFNDNSNVIILDPRGFNIAISLNEFFALLDECGGNLTNNEFNLELCYGWTKSSSRAKLISSSNHIFTKIKTNSDNLIEKLQSTDMITPTKLKIGEIYEANSKKVDAGYYMYMGKMDVYSLKCQKTAFKYNDYKYLDYFIDDRSDFTGKDKYIFYYLGHCDNISGNIRNDIDPYYISSGIAKCFMKCKKTVDPSNFMMYDDSNVKCSYDAIRSDMDHNLVFNRIKFFDKYNMQSVPYELFRIRYELPYDADTLHFWPNKLFISSRAFMNDAGISLKLEKYNDYSTPNSMRYLTRRLENRDAPRQSYYSSSYHSLTYSDDVISDFSDFYNKMKPISYVLEFENGCVMKMSQSMDFVQKECIDPIKYYYWNAE